MITPYSALGFAVLWIWSSISSLSVIFFWIKSPNGYIYPNFHILVNHKSIFILEALYLLFSFPLEHCYLDLQWLHIVYRSNFKCDFLRGSLWLPYLILPFHPSCSHGPCIPLSMTLFIIWNSPGSLSWIAPTEMMFWFKQRFSFCSLLCLQCLHHAWHKVNFQWKVIE